MPKKANYYKPFHVCASCLSKDELTLYRGYFYCNKCFKKINGRLLKRDQEYARQLRMHILETSNQKENK